jgi:hypothetical protein
MLKRMDSSILARANLWDSFSQNHKGLALSYMTALKMDLNYDHASYI